MAIVGFDQDHAPRTRSRTQPLYRKPRNIYQTAETLTYGSLGVMAWTGRTLMMRVTIGDDLTPIAAF
jgi:hypothetical protein